MSITNTIIKVSPADILSRVDDAVDYHAMPRSEALKFLQELAIEIDVRIGWVIGAIREQESNGDGP
jgi:hypothetical protein